MKSLKNILLLSVTLMFYFNMSGQAGAHVHGGLLSGQFKTTELTPEGTVHRGWRIGVDARLHSGKMFFTGGVHYFKYAFDAIDGGEYFKTGDSFSVQKARFGLGWNLFELRQIMRIRAKFLGSVNLISAPDDRDLPSSYERMNDGYASLDFGVGVDVLFFTIDLEYEKGLLNAVNMAPDTKLDYWSLTAGVFF